MTSKLVFPRGQGRLAERREEQRQEQRQKEKEEADKERIRSRQIWASWIFAKEQFYEKA